MKASVAFHYVRPVVEEAFVFLRVGSIGWLLVVFASA